MNARQQEYVVYAEVRTPASGGQETEMKYLVAINYDPYQRNASGDRRTHFSKEMAAAFFFKSEVAAEMAAVTVGGRVYPVHNIL